MAEYTTGTGQELTKVHEPWRCLGNWCVIHNPMPGPWSAWPTHWRSDASRKVIMVSRRLLGEAACRGKAPLFDVDSHHHDVLGKFNSCWLCEDCLDICIICPVAKDCWDQAVEIRESYQVRAGQMWMSGRPVPLHIGKRGYVKPKA